MSIDYAPNLLPNSSYLLLIAESDFDLSRSLAESYSSKEEVYALNYFTKSFWSSVSKCAYCLVLVNFAVVAQVSFGLPVACRTSDKFVLSISFRCFPITI